MIRTLLVLLALGAVAPRVAARQAIPDRQPLRLAPDHVRRAPDSLAIRAGQAGKTDPLRAVRSADPTEDRTFRVQNALSGEWTERAFTLVTERSVSPPSGPIGLVRIWVDAAAWAAGAVPTTVVDSLAEAAAVSTPADPESGIVARTAAIFGPPPDTDGDGALDVILFDIRDDYPSAGGVLILGYFSPVDYDDAAPPGEGNAADVLYLDTDPQIDSFPGLIPETFARVQAQQTLFTLDPDEDAFVVRGLSEWTRLHSGYPGPGRYYLDFPDEHGIGFFFWSEAFQFLGDSQRASLFVNYLEEQFGTELVTAIARHTGSGPDGIRPVLAAHADGRSLEDVVFDFHVANFLNDPAVDARFGHRRPVYAARRAVPTYSADGGRYQGVQPLTVSFNGGGVQYVSWENVRDIQMRVETAGGPAIRARAVLEHTDGTVEVRDFDPDEATTFPGHFERATAVVFFAELDDPAERVTLTVHAAWADTAVPTRFVAYDNGTVTDPARNFALLDAQWEQSTRFVVPDGLDLYSIYLSPFFRNQFFDSDGETPLGSIVDPRDLTLRIRADSAGLPGRILYHTTVEDPRPFEYAGQTLLHFEVALHAMPDRPLGLPDTIHVGLAEAGADGNFLVFAVSDYSVENVSHLSGPIGGTPSVLPLWDVTLRGELLEGTAVPIRAQFRAISTDTDRLPTVSLPRFELYPNPASSRVTIASNGARVQEVAIHDILGRQVVLLRMRPGESERIVDTEGWAPGLYVASAPGMAARPFVVLQ